MTRLAPFHAAALLLFLVGGCGESPPTPTPTPAAAPAPASAPTQAEKPPEKPPAPTGPIKYRKRAAAVLRRQEPDLFAGPGTVHPHKLSEAFDKRLDAIGKRPADVASFEAA